MGKYRFKFSDMIPNAWFYKLKDMTNIGSKTETTTQLYNGKQQQQQQKQPPPPHISLPRYCYYFNSDNKFYNSPINHKTLDTPFPPDPSRKSSRKRKTVYKPSPRHLQSPEYCYCYVSSNESCSLDLDFPESSDSEEGEQFAAAAAGYDYGDSCNCKVASSTTDIIIDLDSNDNCKKHQSDAFDFDEISEIKLPPVLTRPAANFQKEKEQRSRKNGQGIRLKKNSPRTASKKIQGRKSISSSKSTSKSSSKISESFIVVKSSVNPLKDFRESMVEMIVENNLQTAKDLEHLLACYLSLNSSEYHYLIVKAFEQVWFQITTNLSM